MQAVYIHIPFCETICSYCDFCKNLYDFSKVSEYLKTLEKEIKHSYQKEEIKTLYIGGGTPSVLTIKELSQLFSILSLFHKASTLEFTFECNIENITEEKLALLYKNGVNRLSIGVQTGHKKYLHFLNRKHTREEIREKIECAKKVGFTNINIDLMYAFPNETLEEVEEDIQFFLSLDVPHISTYSLIIEPHTLLSIQKVEPISEELDALMYHKICKLLEKNGYIHYEVSNFSKEGYQSNHNLTYWNNDFYYGFGMGASGYVEGVRYENTKSLSSYLEGNYLSYKEILTKKETIENEYILGFRKMQGISKEKFFQKYGISIKENKSIQKLLKEKRILENKEYIYINPKDIYIMNAFLVEFIEEEGSMIE